MAPGMARGRQHPECPRCDLGRDVHGYGEDFVAVRLEGFDFGARVGVPEAHGAVLAAAEDVLGATLGVADDVHWAAMVSESRV